jgi:hypothetical protein
MAYKNVPNFNDCTTITLGGQNEDGKPNPTQIEGFYLGSKVTPAKEYGPGMLHFFQTEKGVIGVWGKTCMNSMLIPALAGQMCRVTFTGMGKKIKGRRPAYLYSVEHDEDNVTDVSGVNVSGSQGEEPEYDADAAAGEADEGGDETQADEAPAARAVPPKSVARAPSAASQAKVQALLGGTRRTV